jgi:hypothetical protein
MTTTKHKKHKKKVKEWKAAIHRNKVVPKAHRKSCKADLLNWTNGMIEKRCESTGTLRSQVGVWTCRRCCCCCLQHGTLQAKIVWFSAPTYDIFFSLLQTSPSSSSSSSAASSSLGTPPHMVAYAWTLWERVTSRTCRSSDDACSTHGALHAWRTLARSLACGTISAKRRSDASSIWSWVSKSGVLAARTCAWRSGAAEWTSEKTSLESLSAYSKLLRDVLDFNLFQISTRILLQVSIWIILSGEF